MVRSIRIASSIVLFVPNDRTAASIDAAPPFAL